MLYTGPKFPYQKLEVETLESGVRHYIDPVNKVPLPSVTTILSKTGDKSFLDDWKARIGEDRAERIKTDAGVLGGIMHQHIEAVLEGTERPQGRNMLHTLARKMSQRIIDEGISRIDEVWGIEANLYMPKLYAGTGDLIAVYDGKPSIIDHKNTRNMKTKEMINDYFCQGSAYVLAHNTLYGTDIDQVVIFMTDRHLKFEAFKVSGPELEQYAVQYLQRVMEYIPEHAPHLFTS